MIRKGRLATKDTRKEGSKERGRQGEKKESTRSVTHKQKRTGGAQGARWHRGIMGYGRSGWGLRVSRMVRLERRSDGFPKSDANYDLRLQQLFCHSFTATIMNHQPSPVSAFSVPQGRGLLVGGGGLTDTAGSVNPTEVSTEEGTVLFL